jgi:hypothetical protein
MKDMLNSQSRRLLTLFAIVSVGLLSFSAHAQDDATRARKYTPPPPTSHVTVAVLKDTNGKPIENAAVIFHMVGDRDKGNMELKTNEEGKAVIDVIETGDTVRLQVIADGFQTFGQDYKIETDSKDITVRLKRPQRQYSTYDHPANSASTTSQPPASGSQNSSPNTSNPQSAPKQ